MHGQKEPTRLLLDSLCKLVNADAWVRGIGPNQATPPAQLHWGLRVAIEDWDGLIARLKNQPITDLDCPWLISINGRRQLSCGSLSRILLIRSASQLGFSERETRLTRIIFEEVSWIYGDLYRKDARQEIPLLPPALARTLEYLRAGYCRKNIAEFLGLSAYTIADYTKEIYRRLDVSSQIELMKKYPTIR